MKTRIYLTRWQRRYLVDGDLSSGYVWHPLVPVLDALPADPAGAPQNERTRISVEIPDADGDGLPDGPALLVIVSAMDIPATLAKRPGVYMLPPRSLKIKLADIPQDKLDKIAEKLLVHSIPPTVLNALDMGDVFDNVLTHVRKRRRRLRSRYAGRETEFA